MDPRPYEPGGPPPAPQLAGPAAGLDFAGTLIRFWAYLIDLIIVGVVGLLIQVPLLQSRTDTGTYLVRVLITFAVHAVYFIALWGNRGQTVGMSVLRLRLVRVEDGQAIDVGRAAKRFIPFGGALLLSPLGWLIWIAMVITTSTDARKQGIHDRLAGTFVVREVA